MKEQKPSERKNCRERLEYLIRLDLDLLSLLRHVADYIDETHSPAKAVEYVKDCGCGLGEDCDRKPSEVKPPQQSEGRKEEEPEYCQCTSETCPAIHKGKFITTFSPSKKEHDEREESYKAIYEDLRDIRKHELCDLNAGIGYLARQLSERGYTKHPSKVPSVEEIDKNMHKVFFEAGRDKQMSAYQGAMIKAYAKSVNALISGRKE